MPFQGKDVADVQHSLNRHGKISDICYMCEKDMYGKEG